MPRIEWKLDGSAIVMVLVTAGSLAVQWGVYSVRLTALEARMDRVSTATEQLTTAVTKVQTQLEERDRFAERRR